MHHSSRFTASAAAAFAVATLLSAGSVSAADDRHEDSDEIAAVLGAKVPVARAIATAEQHAAGRAVKFDVEAENGVQLYEIRTIAGDKMVDVFVDTATGKVVRSDEEGVIGRMLGHGDKAELAALTNAPTTLAAAIATAEQHIGGKAVEADLEDEDGQVLFQVEVARDATIHEVMVDPATGRIVADGHGKAGKRE